MNVKRRAKKENRRRKTILKMLLGAVIAAFVTGFIPEIGNGDIIAVCEFSASLWYRLTNHKKRIKRRGRRTRKRVK